MERTLTHNLTSIFRIYIAIIIRITISRYVQTNQINVTYCSLLHLTHLCILFCGCIFGIVLCISLRFCIWILEDHKMCLCSQAFQTHPTYHDSRSSHHIFCPRLRKAHHRICDHSLGTYDSLIQRNKRKMAINITTNETVNDQ